MTLLLNSIAFRNFHIDQAIKHKKIDSVIAVSRVFDKHPIRIKELSEDSRLQ